MKTHDAILAGLLMAAASLTASAAADKDKEKGKSYDSPQAVFDAAQAANKKDDYKTLIDCLSPAAQKQMASSMAFGALNQQSAAQGNDKFKEQFKPIIAALEKHGLGFDVAKKIKIDDLSPDGIKKATSDVGALIKDPAAFAADLMEAYSKTEGFNAKPPKDAPEPKLADVKIDGDKAKGVIAVTIEGNDVKQPVEFVKIDGGWKLAPQPEPAGGGKDKDKDKDK
jgi:hypothetical protein